MFSFKAAVTLAVLAMLVVAAHCGFGEGLCNYYGNMNCIDVLLHV